MTKQIGGHVLYDGSSCPLNCMDLYKTFCVTCVHMCMRRSTCVLCNIIYIYYIHIQISRLFHICIHMTSTHRRFGRPYVMHVRINIQFVQAIGKFPQILDAPNDVCCYTQRLQCSSFLVMTYFLLRDYDILPKKELLLRLWVQT